MLSSMKSPNNRDKVRDNKKEIGLEMKRESFEMKVNRALTAKEQIFQEPFNLPWTFQSIISFNSI